MKTLLSFLGQIFFVVLAVLGIGLLLFYMDATDTPGIVREIVQRVQGEFSQTTTYLEDEGFSLDDLNFPDLYLPDLTNPDPSDIQITVANGGKMERTDLLPTQSLPIAATRANPSIEILAPASTRTPVPPMDPVVYQTEATIRLKRFVAALERWMVTNDQLMGDNNLLQDAAWRSQVTGNLAEIVAEGQQLADIGQPPEVYAEIDGWLVRAGLETERLQTYYLRALDTGSASDFASASDSFTRIKKYLAQAAQGMLLASWTFEP